MTAYLVPTWCSYSVPYLVVPVFQKSLKYRAFCRVYRCTPTRSLLGLLGVLQAIDFKRPTRCSVSPYYYVINYAPTLGEGLVHSTRQRRETPAFPVTDDGRPHTPRC